MKPTKANKTGIATGQDIVMTPPSVAKLIIEHYNPTGKILEPARGTGSFYNQFNEPRDWCEITEGRNFFDFREKVDWIITNPPYSIFDLFMEHCFEVADNVVVLVPLQKSFKSISYENIVEKFGGLKEIWFMGSGSVANFKVGFPVGCLYYQRGYKGPINYKKGIKKEQSIF